MRPPAAASTQAARPTQLARLASACQALSKLIVPALGGATRQQLNTAFGTQLTEQTQKYLESPPMQLEAMNAMRRRTGKGQKPPRGVRAGVGLVGAMHAKSGGGQGNLQTFAGYTRCAASKQPVSS